MKVKHTVIIMLLPILVINCADRKQDNRLSVLTIQDFETDFNFKYIACVPNEISNLQPDSCLHLYFQDMREKETVDFTIDQHAVLKRSDKVLKLKEYFFETYFKTDDSIYQLKIGTKNLVLRNRNGDILNTYNLDQNYTPIIFPPSNLKYRNNIFLLGNVSSTIGFGLKKDRLLYYRAVKPILLAKIIDTTSHCLEISDFPEKYKTSGDSYNDHLPSACIGKDDNICVSFGADDNLSLYHDSTLLLRKEVKSLYIDKFNPYPDAKLFDMLYLKNYIADEPKYTNIIFDPFKNVYYRVVKHRHNSAGSASIEKTWSVIVIDTELNVLGEMKFSGDYKYDVFIPTPIGVVTAKRNPKHPEKAILSLIKIIKNAN